MFGFVGWMRILEIPSDWLKPTCVHVLPASVLLVDAVAGHDVAADAGLAHADEDDVGIALAHGDGADGSALDLAIRDGRPVVATVGRLPESAARRAEIRFIRAANDAADGDGATAAVGTDVAPLESAAERGVEDDWCERAHSSSLSGARSSGHGRKGNERGNGQAAQREHWTGGRGSHESRGAKRWRAISSEATIQPATGGRHLNGESLPRRRNL